MSRRTVGCAAFLSLVLFTAPTSRAQIQNQPDHGQWGGQSQLLGALHRFNLTFLPMHILGLKGMTRRIYTYPPEMGWDQMNVLATLGAFVIAIGGLMFIANVIWSRRNGGLAGNNPWNADSLEWAAASPPANYNFEYLPVATGRFPLWVDRSARTFVTGLRNDRREVLVTTLMDAMPHHRYVLPGQSIWPFLTAVAVSLGFAGSFAHGCLASARRSIPASVAPDA